MDWLERHLSIFPPPETVLFVGAGAGRNLPPPLLDARRRIVLMEPHPGWAERLRQRFSVREDVEVLECALDDRSGQATLRVFNLPELSSLRPLEGVEALLPGLRQTARLLVETTTLDALIDRFPAPEGAANWLVVDAVGLEETLLSALAEPEVRACFEHVVLRVMRPNATAGAQDLDSVTERLWTLGYRALGKNDDEDGDWIRLHAVRQGESPRERELQTTIDGLRNRSRELTDARTELERRLEQQRKEFEERVAALNEELRGVTEDAERRLSTLGADLERSQRELEESKNGFERRIEALSAELQEKQREKDEALALLKEDSERQKAAAVSAVLTEREEECERLRREHEATRARLNEALEKARADLSVSLRVQSLREADLKELQERYAAVTELKNQQHELLVKLGQRLGAASEYLKVLDAPGGGEDGEDSAAMEGLVEALSGKGDPT